MEKKILVVDDDAMVRRMAKMFLGKAGYQVLEADSGAEALDRLQQEQVDLILLDVEMPGLNGPETLLRLRRLKLEAPVYFLSGSEETEEQVKEGKSPADGFIRKPFLPGVLLETVKQALE